MLDRTDSYCERCGTRYAFGTNAPKLLSLKGARVLAKGLKNFVLTDGQSMNDSLALARHDDDHANSTRMTEEFHRTFNFCMTCRQYACDNCWNPHQAACLTCAPDQGSGPVAPEDHLIVRTPVARSDGDWALFPDILGAAGAPGAAWPAQDLRVTTSDGGAASAVNKGTDQPRRTTDDQETWSVWPIADEIAPEMTLTAGEMVLVEAQLAQDGPMEDAVVLEETVSPQVLPAMPEVEIWATPTGQAGVPAQAVEPSLPAVVDRLDLASRREAAAPEPQGTLLENTDIASQAPPLPITAPPITAPPITAPPITAPPITAPPKRSVVARLFGGLSALGAGDSPPRGPQHGSGQGTPLGDAWPRATAWSQRPISARDWSADENPSMAEPAVEPETAPVAATYLDSTGAPQLPEMEAALEAETAELSPAPESLPEPLADEAPGVDFAELHASTAEPLPAPIPVPEPVAAAEPLPAPIPVPEPVAAAEPLPAPIPVPEPVAATADQQTLFDATPVTDDLADQPGPETVAWPDVFGDVAATPRKPAPAHTTSVPFNPTPAQFSATPAPSRPKDATPPSRGPQAPAPWPPIGASWPARETPGAPWPGPDAPAVPAVVAARETAPPVLAEMWAQSAQQVLNRGSVRVCHHCALPVSTQARFCRRCGTKQA